MIKNYLTAIIRNLWKNKTYGFLNIFGLAIGITCAGLIFLWIEDEVSYDHHNIKHDQLYQVMENQHYDGKTYTFAATPGPLAKGIKDEFPGVLNTCHVSWRENRPFSVGDNSIYEQGSFVDSSIFSMFDLPFVQGRKEDAFKTLRSLVISEKMAAKFFPNQNNIIGKSLKVDNRDEYFITGVIKDIPENSTVKFDWVAPYEIYFGENDWLKQWGNNGVQTFVELDQKTPGAIISKKLEKYIKSKDTAAIAEPFLLSMNDWRLRSKFEEGKNVGGRIQYVKMFALIAWIILLIACINFMNLATARSEKRAREVGVRKVLGAGKRTLIGQFLSESLFLSFLSALLAICILFLVLPAFNVMVNKHLSVGLGNLSHISALVLIALICGLVAGSYPALYLSSFNPIHVFKGLKIKGGTAAIIRKGLVILQFTISIILIISTIIIYQQVQHIKSRELGYDKNNLLKTDLHGNMRDDFPVIKQELLATGSVENAAMSNLDMIDMGSQTTDFRWDGKDPSKKVLITLDFVTPEYISTAGMKLKEGRDFYPLGSNDTQSVIINETFAAMMGKNPVGKILYQDTALNQGVSFLIAGVTKDFVFGDLYGKSDPLVFMTTPTRYNNLYIRLKPTIDLEKGLAQIESVIKKSSPGYPFDYKFVDDDFNRRFQSEALIGKLSRVFALLAIIITCLGLFGLAAYTAERKTKEIGIRKVLGASVSGITALLSKNFLQLVVLSSFIAFPVAWLAMHNWLQNYAYRIGINFWVFILAAGVALMIALLTISFQSVKAAIANPIKSLRTE